MSSIKTIIVFRNSSLPPSGNYTITLHFVETYRTGPGQRIFDVLIEGQLVLDDLDVYAEAGGANTALEKIITGVVVQDGQLDIQFVQSVEQPEINGLEIEQVSSG